MAHELSEIERETCAEFQRLIEEEKQAIADHQLALTLSGLSTDDPEFLLSSTYATNLSNNRSLGTDEQWARAKELYAEIHAYEIAARTTSEPRDASNSDETEANSDAGQVPDEDSTVCDACLDKVPTADTMTLACEPVAHRYCRGCISDLFNMALGDVSLFPPSCCNVPIPLDICRAVLSKEYIKKFDLKVEELATPNPTYCANTGCTVFIRIQDISAGVGTCAECKETTCVQCKHGAHDGLCPTDPHVQLLMDAAKRAKWQQCTKCRNLVELSQGCFHMICRCSHAFCYLCGVPWKTCTCPQWDENYLNRPVPVTPIEPAPEHTHSWVQVRGSSCMDCGADWLPYVMRCSGCAFASCWRCIHNRD
jgi:E3 ubiquitin-protein ligase RNF144